MCCRLPAHPMHGPGTFGTPFAGDSTGHVLSQERSSKTSAVKQEPRAALGKPGARAKPGSAGRSTAMGASDPVGTAGWQKGKHLSSHSHFIIG